MPERSLDFILISALSVVAGVPHTTTAAAPPPDADPVPISWADKLYNPKPAPDDLILPLPCGAAAAFRPVDIPARDPLDDRRVELGQPDAERAYKEGRRFAHIAGAFDVPDTAARRFYIGKYEITRDQYATLMSPECPDATMGGRRPITDITWFDAIDFSRRWTEWLLAERPASLPRAELEPGFLRLPTEEEWEFAARGGIKVSESQFVAPLFPMPEGVLGRYAWHESDDSAQGELSLVGLLAPNPLGLHDILGNAAEMMLSPFQLDHRGRPHGQAGGFVSRGGDFLTPATQLGSAARQEHHLFDARTGAALRRETMGFRLVVTAPVIVSHQRLAAIRQAWQALPTLSRVVDADSAVQALEQLADRTQDAELRRSLQLIRGDLDSAHSAMAEAGDRALNAIIRMGAYLAQRLVTEFAHARSIERAMGMGEQDFESFADRVRNEPGAASAIRSAQDRLNAKMQAWQAALTGVEAELSATRAYYADLIVGVSNDWKPQSIATQLTVAVTELEARDQAEMVPYAAAFVRQLDAYRLTGVVDAQRWQTELLGIAGLGDD